MKRLLLIIILIILATGFAIKTFKNKLNKDMNQIVYFPTTAPSPITPTIKTTKKTTTDLFVPYWTIEDNSIDSTKFDKIIYFGISPTENNINMDEAGIQKMENFLQNISPDQEKHLTLRMTENQQNFSILKNPDNQKKIISQTIEIAKQNNFDGIVLDLEITAIPFDSLIQQINTFTKIFSTQTKENNLEFSMTIYGDTFYRIRPFDIKKLSENVDTIMVMAYDFHKAKSNPGPNFPLSGRETYGYDLIKMTDDFLKFIPPEKLTIIFGLFGYDWTVDENNNAITTGKPLTTQQISQKFLYGCPYTYCKIKKDRQSAETQILYTDEENKKHIIWYEDIESIKQKQTALKQKGITSFSLWANSYF